MSFTKIVSENAYNIELYTRFGELFIDIDSICRPLNFKRHKILSLASKEDIFITKIDTKIINLINYSGLIHLAYLSSQVAFRRWCTTILLSIAKNINALMPESELCTITQKDSVNKTIVINKDLYNPTHILNSSINSIDSYNSSSTSTEENLKDLYTNNSCLLLKDRTYHDFLQRLIMKIMNQIPYVHWEEEISVVNTFNPSVAKTRRFDLVEHQSNGRVIIWEIHTQPIDKDKIVTTLFDKAYLNLARDNYKNREVHLVFTSPEGIDKSGEIVLRELKNVRFVPYQDLLLHAFKMFRLLTPKESQWRLKEEEEQITKIIGNRKDSVIPGNSYKGVIRDKKKFRAIVNHENMRYQVGNFSCPLEAAIAYDKKIKELGIDKPLNFPQLNKISK